MMSTKVIVILAVAAAGVFLYFNSKKNIAVGSTNSWPPTSQMSVSDFAKQKAKSAATSFINGL